jgi:hypothetical protein
MSNDHTNATVVQTLGKVLAVEQRLQNPSGKDCYSRILLLEIVPVIITLVLTDVVFIGIIKCIHDCWLSRPFICVS